MASPTRRRTLLVALLLVVAAVYRLALGTQYYGWEESDYGNLAMVRGVLESGFRHYDMNHLPMYYGLSALVMGVVGDAVLATRFVSLMGGVFTVGLAVVLADRLAGRSVAWVVGGVCVFQPELALYAASSLREPVYAAAVLGALVALSRERLGLASLMAGVAFLTRMDAALTLGPVLLLHALGRGPRLPRVAAAVGPLVLAGLAWSAYCFQVHGTWAFWGHSVSVNIETGGTEEVVGGLAWLLGGARVSLALLLQVLPARIGWGLMAGFLVGLFVLPWRRHDPRRTVGVAALLLLGFWLGIGLTAQHEPGHNLYWKWLHGVLPPVLIIATMGLFRVAHHVRAGGGRLALGLFVAAVAAQGIWAAATETRRQVALSEALYRPQLELAQWLESEVPESVPLLVDNIPGCWLDRRDHHRRLHSWFDVPVPPEDRQEFAAWLGSERIGYVLWFEEEWTQAPVIAPWLSSAVPHKLGRVVLVPLREEPGYGWILYKVEHVDG